MTIHVQRLGAKLVDRGFNVTFYRFTKGGDNNLHTKNVTSPILWFAGLLLGRSPTVHYVISTRASRRFAATLFGIIRRKKIIIRLGGKSTERALAGNALTRIQTVWALRRCSAVIVVNDELLKVVQAVAPRQVVRVIPGFIPPTDRGETIDAAVAEFLSGDVFRVVMCGHIHEKDSRDIYGIWQLLQIAPALIDAFDGNIRIVVFAHSVGDSLRSAVEEFRREVEARRLTSCLLVWESEGELWPVFTGCDLFFRPTLEDGDANSIREAMYHGVRVLASDVVERPLGVTVYELGNLNDCVRKICECSRDSGPRPARIDVRDNADGVIELISELSNSPQSLHA